MDAPVSPPKIASVLWVDSTAITQPTWVSIEDIGHEEAICLSIGLVIKWDEIGITLCLSQYGFFYGCVKFIPAGAIKSVQYLTYDPRSPKVLWDSDVVAPEDDRHVGSPSTVPQKRKRPGARTSLGLEGDATGAANASGKTT